MGRSRQSLLDILDQTNRKTSAAARTAMAKGGQFPNTL
jgi:hypothetical protein